MVKVLAAGGRGNGIPIGPVYFSRDYVRRGWLSNSPDGKSPLLVSSAQRGRAFLGTETSRSTASPGPLDEKVSGATLVDWAAWAASTTFSSTGLKSGYDNQEVDAFRSAIRDTFLGGAVFWVSTPPVRSDDLRGKQFSTLDWWVKERQAL